MIDELEIKDKPRRILTDLYIDLGHGMQHFATIAPHKRQENLTWGNKNNEDEQRE